MFNRTNGKFTLEQVNTMAMDVFEALNKLIEAIHVHDDIIRKRIQADDWSGFVKLGNNHAERIKLKLYSGHYKSRMIRHAVRRLLLELEAEKIAEETGTDFEEVYDYLLDLMSGYL